MAEVSLKIKSDFEKAAADFKSLGATSDSFQKSIQKTQAALEKEGNSIGELSTKARINAMAVTAVKGADAGLRAELSSLQREMQGLIKRGLDPMSPALDKMKTRMGEIQGQLKPTAISFKELNSVFIAGYNLTGGVIAGLAGIGRAAIGGAANLEMTTMAFETMLGSSEKAIKLIDEIRELAKFTPYSQEGLITNSKLLLNFGAAAEEVTGTMSMLGDIAGGNQDKLNSLTLAFAQSSSAGRLMGQDLLQMINAGFNPLQVISQQTGKSMAVLKKEMEAGSISTQMVKNAFISATSEGGRFYKMSEKSSKTLIGQWSNLKDTFMILATTMGSKVTPILTSGFKFINENMGLVLGTMASLTSAFIAYSIATKGAAVVTGLMSVAQGVLNGVMLLNPIGLLIAAIAGLVVAGVFMYKNWEVVSAKMSDIWEAMKTYAAIGWEYIKIAALTSIKYIIEGLMLINKPFIFVIDNIIKAFNKLTGKEIPTMTQSIGNFTGKLDGMIEKSSKKIAALHDQRMAQLAKQAQKENEVSKQTATLTQKAVEESNKKAAAKKAEVDYFKEALNVMMTSEIDVNAQRVKVGEEFFAKKLELEKVNGSDLMAWQIEQTELIKENDKLTSDQKLVAMNALDKAVQKSSQNQLKTQLQFGAQIASYGEQMFSDLATTMQNAGKESKAFAIGMKAMSMAQAGINSFLAFTSVLKDETIWPSWLRLPLAGTILAAGLAKQAAIASTPISAETGLTNYTVPDIRSNRNDGAAVMAQGGEEVSVTPRGESSSNLTNIDISISEQAIFSIVARGIKTGQINLNNKNVGRGVFAN